MLGSPSLTRPWKAPRMSSSTTMTRTFCRIFSRLRAPSMTASISPASASSREKAKRVVLSKESWAGRAPERASMAAKRLRSSAQTMDTSPLFPPSSPLPAVSSFSRNTNR